MRVDPARETHVGELYEDLRPLMFSIAYRMVGSVGDAEDIVQEAFLRFHRASGEGEEIESPKAYLSAITTRLGIDHLRSARVRREQYVGTWLPEPVLTDPSPMSSCTRRRPTRSRWRSSCCSRACRRSSGRSSCSERCSSTGTTRSRVIGKTEDNCRQIAVRARRQVDAKRPRFEASRKRREELARRFFDAVGEEDTEGLIGLLAADVVAYGDGGGKAPAFPRPTTAGPGRTPAARPGGSRCAARRDRKRSTSRSTDSPGPCSPTPMAGWSRPSCSTSPTTSCRPCARSPTRTSCATSTRRWMTLGFAVRADTQAQGVRLRTSCCRSRPLRGRAAGHPNARPPSRPPRGRCPPRPCRGPRGRS